MPTEPRSFLWAENELKDNCLQFHRIDGLNEVIIVADGLTKEGIKYMIARLLENANEAADESKQKKDDPYCTGRKVAYYEMLLRWMWYLWLWHLYGCK